MTRDIAYVPEVTPIEETTASCFEPHAVLVKVILFSEAPGALIEPVIDTSPGFSGVVKKAYAAIKTIIIAEAAVAFIARLFSALN